MKNATAVVPVKAQKTPKPNGPKSHKVISVAEIFQSDRRAELLSMIFLVWVLNQGKDLVNAVVAPVDQSRRGSNLITRDTIIHILTREFGLGSCPDWINKNPVFLTGERGTYTLAPARGHAMKWLRNHDML